MKRFAAVLSLVLLAACHESASAEKPLSVKGEKLYVLTGKIILRDAEENTLRIDHQAIPGFMEAMTMDYPVRGAKVASLPADQSRIAGKLHVTDDTYWLTDVKPAK